MALEKGDNRMIGKLAVKEAVSRSGFTQAELARRLGYGGDYPAQFISNIFRDRKDIGLDRAAEMLAAVGYELVIAPKGSRIPESAMVVGRDD